MGLDTADSGSSPSDVCRHQEEDNHQSLLTPARRAALDALEREFRELLSGPREAA
ncbi:MAG: hypothetical protein ABI830_00845 [Pseudolabrys sp.]